MTRTEPTDEADNEADSSESTTTLTFMCVRNAGRSQMATAFAKREVAARGLDNSVEIVTGGTAPADAIHEVVR